MNSLSILKQICRFLFYLKGKTAYNQCKEDSDCPENYFCNQHHHHLCESKLKTGKKCSRDEMCTCGKCLNQVEIFRGEELQYNVCAAC